MSQIILLAEDAENDELLFKRTLRLAGVDDNVYVVRDGAEALAYLKGEREYADREKYPLPEVMFLDLKMPRMDGFEVLRWIKAQPELKKIPVVVLTNCHNTCQITEAYQLGATSFLTKPCSRAEVGNLMRHVRGG